MRIESSQVSYVATHSFASATAVIDETLDGGRTSTASAARARPAGVDQVHLSAAAGSSVAVNRDDLQDLDPKQRLAVLAIEALLGRQVRWLHSRSGAAATAVSVKAAATASANAAVVHRRTEVHSESEQTSFQARGTVETTDGRKIDFSAALNLQRAFQSYSVTTGTVNTTDPLVVNFGGAPAKLTGGKIAFDLNSDGSAENISFVARGSGFLVLDSNGDGKVNDGRELFGPQSGNGFSELAAYDADGNGWIDENDPVFAKLQIWSQDGLSSLADKGIGAIATSSAETPFAIKDSANALQGNIRASGIYLSESGLAGTIQQVDLAES